MFDEYYSVSLSFWTRAGLREKARQGHLVGSLPWGYVRNPRTGGADPEPSRAPLVTELFERYATGQESDRTLAAWLNAKGARTARDRAFGKDTVREMLCNATYCGYVTALRSTDRSIRGHHQPLITDALFDWVQAVRSWRTRVVKPGPPSEDYLLRKLLYCERCGSRMHGTRGSRGGRRRYLCATRRHGGDCRQPITQAEPLGAQLVDWIADFQPDAQLRTLAIQAISAQASRRNGDGPGRRFELHGQLERLRDLYVLGDLTKSEYVLRLQALQEELERQAPPFDPQLEKAEQVLGDFTRFWHAEPSAAERRKLLATLFDRIWRDDGHLVAVKPHPAFARYFETAESRAGTRGVKSGSDGGQTRECHPADRDPAVATAGALSLNPRFWVWSWRSSMGSRDPERR